MRKVRYFLQGAVKRLISHFRRDLGMQIAFFYLLFVVPVVIIGFFLGRAINARLQEDVMTADLALARSIAQETELNLTNARYAAQELARYSEVLGSDQAAVEEIYTKLAGTQSKTNPVSLLGNWWVVDNPIQVGWDIIPSEVFLYRDFLQRTELTSPVLSNGWYSSPLRQPVVTSIVPLWDGLGNVFSVVVSNIKLNILSTTLANIVGEYQISSSEGFEAMIVDGSRKIVAHPDIKLLLRSTSDLPASVVNDVLQGNSGNQVIDHKDDQRRLYSYAPIPGTRWGVIVSRPTEVAFATSNAFTRSMLIVVSIFLIVGMVFWVGLSRRVIRPLEKLAVFSQAISDNKKLSRSQRADLETLTNRGDQVGYLTETLVQMETDIEARLDELATLLQTSAEVVSTLENQTVLERILEQVEQLLDVKMSAIVALDRRDGTFRAQASRGITRSHTSQLTVEPNDNNSIILRALRSRSSVQVSDTETDPSFGNLKDQARASGYRSVLAIPLQTLYASPSALIIFHTEPHIFSDREISLLTNFANHAAMAIENATLYARSDMRLQEQTRRLEALIQSLKDGLILESLDGKVVYANRQMSKLINLSEEEIVGSSADEILDRLLVDVQDAKLIKEKLRTLPDQLEPSITEFEIQHRGRKINLRILGFRVTDMDGVVIGRGRIFYDVTADREIDHMKSRLVSTVSHELRTPLASIKGYATTLLADDVEWDVESQREFLQIISAETDRLSAMVTDLLDLSKIEAGSLSIHRSESDLAEIIGFASQRAYPQPDGRLRVDLPNELPSLYLDKRLIEAVFRNLIENASKYAGEQSPIYITAEMADDHLMIHVEDEGPGIPEEYQTQIFESFYQPAMNINHKNSGFGLGLTICKGFVEAHGGKIWIEPCSTGACVAFSLPYSEV